MLASKAFLLCFTKKWDPPLDFLRRIGRFALFLLALFIYSPLIHAEETSACNASECNYSVNFDKAGFYVAAVTLPPGQKEGLWGLLVDPPIAHPGGFIGGGVLEDYGVIPSWIGFSLSQTGSVQIIPHNFSDATKPFSLEVYRQLSQGQRESVLTPMLVSSDQTYPLLGLTPGFYVAALSSQPTLSGDFVALSVTGANVFGGVSGGWLDVQTGIGFSAFSIDKPQTVNFKLLFGETVIGLGAGQPHLEVYYQKADGTRESKWSSPASTVPAATSQEIPHLITTRVTDPQTNLGFIVVSSNEKELMAIYGEKDSQGNLKSVTDLSYALKETPAQDAPTQAVNLSFGDGVTKPKLTIEFPIKDGKQKKIKVENYDPDKKEADLTFVEQDEMGNEEEVAKATQQKLDLPEDSCYENPLAVEFSSGFTAPVDASNDCANKWGRGMITKMMGMFCDVAPGIFTIIDWFQQAGDQGSFCKPFKDVPEESSDNLSCHTKPLSDLLTVGDFISVLTNCKNPLNSDCIEGLFELGKSLLSGTDDGECKESPQPTTGELLVDITCNGAKSCDVPYGGTVSLEVHYSNVGESGRLHIRGSNMPVGVDLVGGYKYVLPAGDGILKLILENYSPILKCWQNEAAIWPDAGDSQRTASKIDVAKVTLLGAKSDPSVPCYYRLREASEN